MAKTKLEKKFVVVNYKKIMNPDLVPRKIRAKFFFALHDVNKYLHAEDKRYYVCNADESYANKVIKTILDGEDAKE